MVHRHEFATEPSDSETTEQPQKVQDAAEPPSSLSLDDDYFNRSEYIASIFLKN
jgi:hypothetical protein